MNELAREWAATLTEQAAQSRAGTPIEAGPPTLLRNLHFVSDGIWRSAQPGPSGFDDLKKLGVATILDLQDDGDEEQWERSTVLRLGMNSAEIPMSGIFSPSDSQVYDALAAIASAQRIGASIAIHCKYGDDRTGVVCACWRMYHDHWTPAAALAEANICGMHRLQFLMRRYIATWKPLTWMII
jgi:protein tyrosine/serine phosphatase